MSSFLPTLVGCAAFSLAACQSFHVDTSSSSADATVGQDAAGAGSCVPGAHASCRCISGGASVQICLADGSRYGPCECRDGSSATGQRGSSTSASSHSSRPASSMDGGARDGPAGDDGGPDAGRDAACSPSPLPDSGVEAGTATWSAAFGITGQTTAAAVAVNPSNGDLLVAGGLEGTVDLGGGRLPSPSDAGAGSGLFLASYTSAGAYASSAYFPGKGATVQGLAASVSGDVYLSGVFPESLALGRSTLTATGDVDSFLVAIGPSGAVAWTKDFGVSGATAILGSVAVDSHGDVIFSQAGQGGGYVLTKYKPSGDLVWLTAITLTFGSAAPTFVVDGADNLVVAGSFTGTANFGLEDVTSVSSRGDAFVAKYDSTGAYLWANQYTPTGTKAGADVALGGLATDPCGDIFALGEFGAADGMATLDLGAGTLRAPGGSDAIFLARLTAGGGAVWSKAFSFEGTDLVPRSLTVDPSGGPVLASLLSGSVNYGGDLLTSASPAATLAAFDPAGGYLWSYLAGPAAYTTIGSPAGLAATVSGVAVAGSFGGCSVAGCPGGTSPPGTTLTLPGGGSITAAAQSDLFLATFAD